MNLPYDVWRYIVEFVPNDSLRHLLGVNHMLFEMAMDKRYRVVAITKIDERNLWILSRLRDPSIASRVRSLKIRPCFEDEFINIWVMKHLSVTLANRARNILYRTFRIPVPSWHSTKLLTLDIGGTSKVRLSRDGVIGDMIETLSKLACVSEFSIMGWVSGFGVFSNMGPLYEACFAAFGSNLRKLLLVREIANFREVLRSSPHFPRLEELRIVFACESDLRVDAPDYVLRELVAPFINRHRCTIRSFAVTSSRSTLDLSALFVALDPFSILHRIALDITFNYTFRSDCSGFARLLREHADTLQHVDFKVIIGPSASPRSGFWPESFRGTWLTENRSGEAFFSRLKTLKLSAVHHFDILLCARASADTLTKLTLEGRFLPFEEVDSLVNLFSHRTPDSGLRSLCINVRIFSPQLMCLLARKLSGLRELSINCKEFSPRSSFEANMPSFDDWYLYDIGVWFTGSFGISHRIELDALFMIAAYVPSIQSFWGQGHKEEGKSSYAVCKEW